MIVRNLTRNTTISKDLKVASSLFDRLLGLINKNNPRSLLFDTRYGIHTFFLQSSIDVLLLDEQNRVVRMRKKLEPFSFYFYPPRHHIVIELPAGTIHKSLTSLNDIISLE